MPAPHGGRCHHRCLKNSANLLQDQAVGQLQNLVSAIEAEGVSAGSLVSAVTTRERNIAALEARLRQARTTPDMSELRRFAPGWPSSWLTSSGC